MNLLKNAEPPDPALTNSHHDNDHPLELFSDDLKPITRARYIKVFDCAIAS
ncbi:MAG: hypothetical protein AAGA77_16290 [Bacteroidota bacterium]